MTGIQMRILVIDDEYVIRQFLSEILGFSGYLTDLAASAAEGIALAGQCGYDLVISDLDLPERSGWEVARALKAQAPKPPFILMSGWNVGAEDPRIQECGVDLVLSKPCQMDEILHAVDSILKNGKGASASARQ
jgi:DNA-binding response OmpR family regulator